MLSRTAILIACTLVAACMGPGPYPGDEENYPAVRIRIANAAEIDFDSVIIHFPNQVEQYGSLPAGQTSEYRNVAGAYRYAYSVAQAGGRRFVLQPIDFVGERPLRAGSYTYRLSAEPPDPPSSLDGRLDIRLLRDRIGD